MVRKIKFDGKIEVPASFIEKRLGNGNVHVSFIMGCDDYCYITHSDKKSTSKNHDIESGTISDIVAPVNGKYHIPTYWASNQTANITFNESEKRIEIKVI